MQITEGKAAS